MVQRKIITALLTVMALAAGLTAGCAPYTVKTDFDPDAAFQSYRTFAFMERSPRANSNPLVMKRIQRAIKDDLEMKGFKEAALSIADVLVSISGSKEDVLDISTSSAYRSGYHWQTVDVQQYTEGTLFIDFVERSSKELVWRGAANGVLSDDPGRDEEKVRKLVTDMLVGFPPGAGSKDTQESR